MVDKAYICDHCGEETLEFDEYEVSDISISDNNASIDIEGYCSNCEETTVKEFEMILKTK